MNTAIYISFGLMFFVGATKMFLWPKLWNKKPWWPTFNLWYGKLMIVCTLFFFGVGLWELVKFLFQ